MARRRLSNANTNDAKGDGDAWACIVEGDVVRRPATRYDLNNMPPRRGNNPGPNSLNKSDLLGPGGN